MNHIFRWRGLKKIHWRRTPPIKSTVDGVRDTLLHGWLFGTADPARTRQVRITLGNRDLGVFAADRYRGDLAEAGLVNPYCAFSVDLSHYSEFLAQDALARIHVYDLESGAELRGSPVDRNQRSTMTRAINAPGADQPNRSVATHHCAIEFAAKVGESGLFIEGWSNGRPNDHLEIELYCGGHTVRVLDRAARANRPDLALAAGREDVGPDKAGYIAYIPACLQPDAMARPGSGISAAAFCNGVKVSKLGFPPLSEFPSQLEAAKVLLRHLRIGSSSMRPTLDRIIGPALSSVARGGKRVVPDVTVYRTPPASPKVSVIVPLYGRLDFVEFQLSGFANDPAFLDEVELIYVLDDPRQLEWFPGYCASLARLYRVPFKAVTYAENLGYAAANNVGAQFAAAPHLLLLNSDVMPGKPGWVSRMRATYDSLPDCGALGIRLLFADGSLQHDGIEFERFTFMGDMWINTHPGKGLPPRIAGTGGAVSKVPAVTGASLMIARELYDRLGGLDEGYLVGDFEDTDLCLNCLQSGRHNYLIRSEHLVHLEQQSQPLFDDQSWKAKLSAYNCWRHTKKWDPVIESVQQGAF